MENSVAVPQKVKNGTIISSGNSTFEYIFKRIENRV
jgi:hypothetical protein